MGRHSLASEFEVFSEKMLAARLNSNAGDEYLEIRPTRFEGEYLESDVCVCLRNWASRHEERHMTIDAGGFGLSLSALSELQNKLYQWLESPSVGTDAFSGHFQLGHSPACGLDLNFAQRPDTIASSDKPVVTINLSVGTTLIEFRFVTDQSCLGMFEKALSQLRPT